MRRHHGRGHGALSGAVRPADRAFQLGTSETIAIGTSALRIICVGFIVSTISVVASGSLEGLGMGVQSLVISLCRYIVVIMPLAWLFCRLLGADGIWNAFWVTEVITAGISLVVYHKSVKLK